MHEKYIDTLEDLCETMFQELDECNEKIRAAGGKISAGDVEMLDKLTHTLKSVKTTLAMMEYDDDGHSERGRSYTRGGERSYRGGKSNWGSYDDGYDHGNSSRRDRMGRYSRAGGTEQLVNNLEAMRMDTTDENVRSAIERCIRQIEN